MGIWGVFRLGGLLFLGSCVVRFSLSLDCMSVQPDIPYSFCLQEEKQALVKMKLIPSCHQTLSLSKRLGGRLPSKAALIFKGGLIHS